MSISERGQMKSPVEYIVGLEHLGLDPKVLRCHMFSSQGGKNMSRALMDFEVSLCPYLNLLE